MSAQEYTLEEISYSRKEDRRIIEAVLKSWFKDPKTLNFVDPRMTFPFKFKKWVNLSYSNSNTSTLVLKIGDWIIGYISLVKIENIGHLFHLYIDPSNRGNGLGKKLIHAIEDRGMNLGCDTFSLNVAPKNENAIELYKCLGYKKTGQSGNLSIKMQKSV